MARDGEEQGQCEPRAEMQAALAIYAEAKPALGEAKGRGVRKIRTICVN